MDPLSAYLLVELIPITAADGANAVKGPVNVPRGSAGEYTSSYTDRITPTAFDHVS